VFVSLEVNTALEFLSTVSRTKYKKDLYFVTLSGVKKWISSACTRMIKGLDLFQSHNLKEIKINSSVLDFSVSGWAKIRFF
jgi:hypothetical protein